MFVPVVSPLFWTLNVKLTAEPTETKLMFDDSVRLRLIFLTRLTVGMAKRVSSGSCGILSVLLPGVAQQSVGVAVQTCANCWVVVERVNSVRLSVTVWLAARVPTVQIPCQLSYDPWEATFELYAMPVGITYFTETPVAVAGPLLTSVSVKVTF